MATTNGLQCSGTISMLLLPQLVQIWLPDHGAVRSENCSSPLNKQAPRSQIPSLISFLEGLTDAITPDDLPDKMFPCGHVVGLRAILACCNFLGDVIWTPGPHLFGCAEPDCEDTLELPKLPDPRVVDGLEARLDLIEWSWRKDKPTEPDLNTVSLLRDILSRIGHLSQNPEPEADAELSPREPSEYSLMQTLVHMEIEAFALMADMRSAEIAERGDQPYCSYRAIAPTPKHSQLRYPFLSPGQYCTCTEAHEYEREPGTWGLTPAETNLDNDEPRLKKAKKPKSVRFVAPVVTEVQYFEPWWCDEYRDSDRYWSMGPYRPSSDLATSADDDWEIEILENPGGLAAELERGLDDEDGESDCDTLFEDVEVLDEINEDEDEDDEMLDGPEGEDGARDEEIGDMMETGEELGEECF